MTVKPAEVGSEILSSLDFKEMIMLLDPLNDYQLVP